MQEPWRGERVVTSSTEAAAYLFVCPRASRYWGGDYSRRLFVNDYHSKVELSLSKTHCHHTRNIRGQVPRGVPGEPEWAPKFRRDGPSVRRWTVPRRP